MRCEDRKITYTVHASIKELEAYYAQQFTTYCEAPYLEASTKQQPDGRSARVLSCIVQGSQAISDVQYHLYDPVQTLWVYLYPRGADVIEVVQEDYFSVR